MDYMPKSTTEAHSDSYWSRWSLGIVIIVILVGILIVFLAIPTQDVISDKSNQMKATSNCRQIIMAMKAYAADHNGKYPTGRTANEVFRELVRADILQDERIFGSPLSRFVPDKDVGLAPDFAKAVGPGENHWMMLGGLRDDSLAIAPVVFENSLEASWPPIWDGSPYEGIRKRGQTWKGGRIVVGTNDGSVVVERLGGDDLRRKTFPVWGDGRSILDLIPKAVVLDIEE